MPLVPTDRAAGAAQQRWRNGQEPALTRWIDASAVLAGVAFPLHSSDQPPDFQEVLEHDARMLMVKREEPGAITYKVVNCAFS